MKSPSLQMFKRLFSPFNIAYMTGAKPTERYRILHDSLLYSKRLDELMTNHADFHWKSSKFYKSTIGPEMFGNLKV